MMHTGQDEDMADKSLLLQVDGGNSILKNLETDINNEDMPSDEDAEDNDDDPELLNQLE